MPPRRLRAGAAGQRHLGAPPAHAAGLCGVVLGSAGLDASGLACALVDRRNVAGLDQGRKRLQLKVPSLPLRQLTGGLQRSSSPGDSCRPVAGGGCRITWWWPLSSEVRAEAAEVLVRLLAEQRPHALFHRIVGHGAILPSSCERVGWPRGAEHCVCSPIGEVGSGRRTTAAPTPATSGTYREDGSRRNHKRTRSVAAPARTAKGSAGSKLRPGTAQLADTSIGVGVSLHEMAVTSVFNQTTTNVTTPTATTAPATRSRPTAEWFDAGPDESSAADPRRMPVAGRRVHADLGIASGCSPSAPGRGGSEVRPIGACCHSEPKRSRGGVGHGTMRR